METEVKTRRKIQLRMPGRRTATGKNASLLLIKRNKVLYLFILPAFLRRVSVSRWRELSFRFRQKPKNI